MSRLWRSVVVLLLAAAVLLPAQSKRTKKGATTTTASAPFAPDSWPLATIRIEGNQNYSREQVLGIAQLKVGQMSNKAGLEAAQARLMASGVFDRAGYRFQPAKDGEGMDVTLDVTEVNVFFPILFEDLPVDEAKLRAWLKEKDPLFGPRIPGTKESLAHYTQLVSEYLAAHNFTQAITAKLSAENPPDLVILMRPDTPRPTIAQVTALHTGEIVPGVVQSTLYGVAVGTIYSEQRVRQLLYSSIRPLYEAKGHIQVTFPKIEGEPAKDVKGVAVTFTVDEGPVFNFGGIRFAGSNIEPDELQNLAKLKTGTVANFDDVKAAQGRIVAHLKHQGFLKAETKVSRYVHPAEKVVDLTFHIDPGPEFTFHTLTLAGLDIETEPIIRKLWGLQPGKPYNPDYPDHFLERVKEMEVFDNLKSSSVDRKINDDHTVDVTLTFKFGETVTQKKSPRRGPF